ncbi:MAG: hypothetical protein NWE93_10095 [Candidatus Bathyarchaeota archaeon]|nr:hypothetical protein [Candidatus Bathyarchaeota archaeon]
MEILFLPNETLFLTFKLSNGSGWLTSHRLILCFHPTGHLEGSPPALYHLKNFKKAQIKGSALIVQFQDKTMKINLQIYSSSLLQEIKEYIEEAAKNWSASKTTNC